MCFLISFACAVEFTIDKGAEFDKGETLTASISGNFIDAITKDKIHFYRDHVPISVDYGVAVIGGEYYIYALLNGFEAREYKMVIEDVEYYKAGGIITNEDIERTFTVTGNFTDFSVDPGFEISYGEDFQIKVQNLQDSQITLDINKETITTSSDGFLWFDSSTSSTSSEGSVILKAGEIKYLKFKVDEPDETHLEILKLSSSGTSGTSYDIPIYLIAEDDGGDSGRMRFGDEEIEVAMATNYSKTWRIKLYNTGDADLENITFLVSPQLEPYIEISPENISELEENESVDILLTISSDSEEDAYEGQVKAIAHPLDSEEEKFAYSIIRLSFIKDFVSVNNDTGDNGDGDNVFKTCEELGGGICETDEVCDDDNEVNALDGICCVGDCEVPNSSNAGKIIGWVLIIVIVIFVAWFFLKKYRGTKNSVSLFKGGKK